MELRNICYVLLWSLILSACGGDVDVDVDANKATTVETRVDIFDGAALGCNVKANGVLVTEDGNGKYTLSGVFSDGVVVSASGCIDSDTQSNLPQLLGVVLSDNVVISPITTLVVASALAAKVAIEGESFQFSGQTLSVLEIESASINVVTNLGLGKYDPINSATANYVNAAKLDTTGTGTDAVAMRIGLAISTLIKAIEVLAGDVGSPFALAAVAKAVVDSSSEIDLTKQAPIEAVMASAQLIDPSVAFIIKSASLAISGVVALIGGSSSISDAISATTIASAFLNTATETTITDTTAIEQLELSVTDTVSINAPTNLTAFASTAGLGAIRIELNWTDNSNHERYFVVQRSASQGSDFETIFSTVSNNITSYTDYELDGLTTDATYYYRIYAVDGSNNSGFSNEAFVATSPTAPSELAAVATSSSSITLSWADNATTETSYVIQRSVGSISDAV
ncbi:MAG: hypothetical protein ACI9V8_001023, partial [Urechidicola sp.]